MLKRLACAALIVVIISLSVGSKYFDSGRMYKVEAAAETVAAGLSAAALYALCYYVGTVAYAHAPIEMSSLSDDQIASMGYSTISYMAAGNMLGMAVSPSDPAVGFIDKAGQAYVFGTNAVKAVAETSFSVIQGGKNSDDDDEGGKKNNVVKFPNLQNVAACTAVSPVNDYNTWAISSPVNDKICLVSYQDSVSL